MWLSSSFFASWSIPFEFRSGTSMLSLDGKHGGDVADRCSLSWLEQNPLTPHTIVSFHQQPKYVSFSPPLAVAIPMMTTIGINDDRYHRIIALRGLTLSGYLTRFIKSIEHPPDPRTISWCMDSGYLQGRCDIHRPGTEDT